MYIKRATGGKFGKTYVYYGAKAWNSLPSALKNAQSLEIFKTSCETFLINKSRMDTSNYSMGEFCNIANIFLFASKILYIS